MGDRGIRVELGENPTVLMSADFGTSWTALSPEEARRLAAQLCIHAERVDERETEREQSAV